MVEGRALSALRFVLALPIFPARLQASIVGASELNFRVRDGNGWTLTAINTNLLFLERSERHLILRSKIFSGVHARRGKK